MALLWQRERRFLSDQTTRSKGQKLNRFAFVCKSIETLNVVAATATGEVDNVSLLGADKRPQLPMSIERLAPGRNSQADGRTVIALALCSVCGRVSR